MIKQLLILSLLSYTSIATAQQAYNARKCEQLKKEHEYIKKRFAAGYTLYERNYLNTRDRELFTEIAKYCKTPTTTQNAAIKQPAQLSTRPKNISKTPQQQAKQPSRIPNLRANNTSYTGDKKTAWDNFYKIPSRCRSSNTTNADFVYCAENKKMQRQAFEEKWREQNRKSN